MTSKRLLILVTTLTLCVSLADRAAAVVRRERTERRPSITEIGEPYSITMATLQRESVKISDLREYLIRNGYPDYAEVQEVSPEWPWESYEVRLYYMHWDLEVDFGHVLFSDAMADLGVLKFQGEITPEKRHEIEVILQARQTPPAAPLPAPSVVDAPPPPPPPVPVAPAAMEPVPDAAALPPEAMAPPSGSLEMLVARLVEQSEAAVSAADRTISTVDKL